MKPNLNISDAFTLEDIRKVRNYYADKYTDENGNIDWDGLSKEIEEGAAKGRTEIARIRSERSKQAIAQ